MAADLEAQTAELPTAFTFDSVAYTASSDSLRSEDAMGLDGYTAHKTRTIRVALSQFASVAAQPAENDSRLLTIDSVNYRVALRDDIGNGVEVDLHLRKQN